MKFSIAAIFLSASMVSSSIMKKARRLDQQAVDGEFNFLVDYNLKVLACISDQHYVCGSCNETGIAQSIVIYRLCPTSGECSDDVGKSCTAGYGDYLIGINTFVQEYLQQKREEMQNDDDSFQFDQLGECHQYKAHPDGAYADSEFYVGPAWHCSATTRVRLRKEQLPLKKFLPAGRYHTQRVVLLRHIVSRVTAPTTMVKLV
jgi:hypothetical protein